eukprot:391374-Amphidinium_carterae.3
MNTHISKFTLSQVLTVIGLAAIQQEHKGNDHTMLEHCTTTHQQNTIHNSIIALSSAEAELYAMGQATLEAQHIKQAIEEMAVPNLSALTTMSINTNNSAGINKKTNTCNCFLYIQDIVQRGQCRITKIPTTHSPADVLTKHLPDYRQRQFNHILIDFVYR